MMGVYLGVGHAAGFIVVLGGLFRGFGYYCGCLWLGICMYGNFQEWEYFFWYCSL